MLTSSSKLENRKKGTASVSAASSNSGRVEENMTVEEFPETISHQRPILPALVDSKMCKYPFCIVWTPIPLLT